MLYEILKPIKDYIVASTFKEAVKQFIKKHELDIMCTKNPYIYDLTQFSLANTQP